MIKTVFLLAITLIIVYLGLEFVSHFLDAPRAEIFSWTGIIIGAFLLERGIKYILLMPFKMYLGDVRKHALGKAVQETGIALSYISVWLAVGFTPINAFVQGKADRLEISYPIFLKIAVVLITSTILFSLLWWATLKLKR